MTELVHWSIADGIGRVTLDHPPLNILTHAVLEEFQACLEAVARDPALRVVLLDARGKHFSAGADVSEHLPPTYRSLISTFLEVVRTVDQFPLPVVAAVQGRCLGGGLELLLGTDVIVAADDAMFGQPEILLGVFPPAACAWLPDIVPLTVASAMIYTGDPIGAAEAQQAGLVTRVTSAATLPAVALDLAHRIAHNSAAALRHAKLALREGGSAQRAARLTQAGRLYLDDLMRTRDATEGLRAFLEKRTPEWSHA